MPLDKTSIAGYVAVTGEKQNVTDAYQLTEDSPFHISRSFDEVSGYRTKSMLVVPMRDHEDKVIGVVQLINKKRDRDGRAAAGDAGRRPGDPVHRDRRAARRARSPARPRSPSRTPTCCSGCRKLFDDLRSRGGEGDRAARPHHLGPLRARGDPDRGPDGEGRPDLERAARGRALHARADRGGALRRAAARLRQGGGAGEVPAQGQEALRQPDDRDAPALRVHPEVDRGRLPARAARRRSSPATRPPSGSRRSRPSTSVDAPRRSACGTSSRRRTSRRWWRRSACARSAACPHAASRAHQTDVEDQDPFPVEDWADGPYLSTKEVELLSIRKGSLSESERRKIEEHVTETYKFLQKLPWTGELRARPRDRLCAPREAQRHRATRASSRPREIPRQSQMMTISDIYDALVASDRPYKKAVSEERAREILCEEAREGKLDQELLRVFLEAEIYRLPAVQGTAAEESVSRVAFPSARDRPPGRLGPPSREHARRDRGRARARRERRRDRRAARRATDAWW